MEPGASVSVSCRLSAAGIRFRVILPPLGVWAFLAVGLPSTLKAHADPIGVATFHTSETRPGWVPPLPRGRRCSPAGTTSPDRRLPHRIGHILLGMHRKRDHLHIRHFRRDGSGRFDTVQPGRQNSLALPRARRPCRASTVSLRDFETTAERPSGQAAQQRALRTVPIGIMARRSYESSAGGSGLV
jgi:hypothetical protein